MLHVPFYAALIQVALADGPFPDNDRALDLLLGTCAQESAFTYTTQLGGGPARGYMQCEPATEADIWAHYLAYEAQASLVSFLATRCGCTGPDVDALEHNMVYQILLARVHYLRCDPARLPAVGDLPGQARTWKTYYNTPAGHGTEAQYIASYEQMVAPVRATLALG
jgi:hypothetical protein